MSEQSPPRYFAGNVRGHVVVGAGGAGVNAVEALAGTCDRGVVIDFDNQNLQVIRERCGGWVKALRPSLPKSAARGGQRAAQMPAIERALASYSSHLSKELAGGSCVTLFAGLGGRAGSTIGPWVAETCVSLRIPLYAGLIFPAAVEGVVRHRIAEAAAARIRSSACLLLEYRAAALLPAIRPGVLMMEYYEAINELQRRLVGGAGRYNRYLGPRK